MAFSQELTNKVKRKLNITWSDQETDARVIDLMDNAAVSLRHKIGLAETFDFEAPGQEQSLFLSLCLYEWNHAANEFDSNYANDLMQARQRRAVEQAREEAGDADQTIDVQ